MLRRLTVVAAPVGLALSVSGCAKMLPADDVETQIKTRLTKTLNKAPDWVSCPKDLKAEDDAKIRCTTRFKGRIYGVAVTVTDVKGGVVSLDVKKDPDPKG